MKKKILRVSLLFNLLNLTSVYAQENPTENIINDTIIGIIKDSETHEPIIGAKIEINGIKNHEMTNEEGLVQIYSLNSFPIEIFIHHPDYKRLRTTINSNNFTIELIPKTEDLKEVIIVTSRRKKEKVQEVPIPISTINGAKLEDTGAFNLNRVKELIPSVQLYASNARNTTLNIRGLGSTYGLTNDGIDPGVGFYMDGVYIARPAATWLDFIDVEQIEVLRGPQGTLFGKNTTSGAFNITSRLPKFIPEVNAELSYGNQGYIQAKTSITGPLVTDKLAARFSFSGTQRDGNLYNIYSNQKINDINNIGFKGQLLYQANKDLKFVLSGDLTSQKPNGYGWAVAGVVKTQRADYRQFDAIIKDLGYSIPYQSAFDRKVDLNTQSKADNKIGGIALNTDLKIGNGTLTSTTAWRHWKWDPLNDRDYLGIPVYSISAGNSVHDQWSQEFRYSGKINENLNIAAGVYSLWQDLHTDPVHTEEAGSALWRFQKNTDSPLWETPGLFDGYGIKTKYGIKSTSLAVYTQLDWKITPQLHILPGIRYNYDKKKADYDRQTYGGLQTTDPELLALKNAVYSNQAFDINADADNWSGQLSVQYIFNTKWNAYATYAKSYKPIGINVGGLPRSNGRVMTELAEVKPESVNHYEFGFKSNPTRNTLLNITVYQSDVKDYQTQVQTPEPGVNRGYLANAEKVRVKGIELDGNISIYKFLDITAAIAYTDAKYVKFTNAPVPLEEVGGSSAFKDVSGGKLPGVSKWSWSLGTEAKQKGKLIDLDGSYFIGADLFYRSEFSSSSSPSKYLNIDGYAVLNARIGFKANNGISFFLWSRNLTNKNYYEQLLAAPGSYGQYAGVVADPRTYGITFRYNFKPYK